MSDEPSKALYLSALDLPHIGTILANLKTRVAKEDLEICVVTDGSRVLGLGDLGVGGMGISMGKLSLYVAAGGINPKAVRAPRGGTGTDEADSPHRARSRDGQREAPRGPPLRRSPPAPLERHGRRGASEKLASAADLFPRRRMWTSS